MSTGKGGSQVKLKAIGLLSLMLILVVLMLMVNQHNHYMDARLNAVQDYQEAFHGDVFHVLTFVRAHEGQGYMPSLRTLVDAAADTEAKLIYAGQVIHTGIRSQQISETFGDSLEWQAILLQQFDSQEDYAAYLNRPEVDAALAGFAVSYTHGFERSAGLNVLLHQMFLAMRLWRGVTFAPDILPFERSPVAQPVNASAALLQHARDLGRDAILIVNLARNGNAEQQAANASYGSEMLGLMADLRYGPMHLGTTISLEHNHTFDQAMLVYYPGAQYFHDLAGSTWFQGIIGDKQLADTQACITVPITNLLKN